MPSSRSMQSLPLGDYFKTGWELFKQYPGGFIGFFLVNAAIGLILCAIPLLGWLLYFAVSPALIMGNFIVSAKLLQRQTPGFRDFFAGFHFFLPLLLLSLVTSILIAIGLALLIIPGIYLAVAYLFTSCLVIDRRLDFWPAMELSRRTVNPLWFAIFTFIVLLVVINLLGGLLLGLGLLVSVPLSYCVLTVAYADLFGFQS
ncbi:MAG TPA: hypothetical protein VE082_02665, partial [Desulfobaccales bacterium]|nr:hypothetical protein [Desulfobaccales bacterium]